MWREHHSLIRVERLKLTTSQLECENPSVLPSFASPGVFGAASTDTPAVIQTTRTAFSTIVSRPEPALSEPLCTSIISSDSFIGPPYVLTHSPAAMSTTASQSIMASLSPFPSLLSLASLHDEGLSSAT